RDSLLLTLAARVAGAIAATAASSAKGCARRLSINPAYPCSTSSTAERGCGSASMTARMFERCDRRFHLHFLAETNDFSKSGFTIILDYGKSVV
ncbi:MAG: hypothetical protein VW935_06125, partial [Novosphingobium sp.]